MPDPVINVAVVGVGPVGTGEHGRGIPALVSMLEELSRDCRITVYCLLRADPAHVPPQLTVRCVPFRTWFLWLDLFMLATLIVTDHLARRIRLLHAVDAYPAGAMCVTLGKWLKIPCVLALLGEELWQPPSGRIGRVRSAREQRKIATACSDSDALVLLTRFQARDLGALGLENKRRDVVPLGIDVARFPFSARRLEPPFVFLHVAYAHPVKGLDRVLEVFKAVSAIVEARLVVVGAGHRGGHTEQELARLELNPLVRLVAPVSNRDLAGLYRQAHFLLQTSWYESQGVVFNEAMASGTVVCSSAVGLVADLGSRYCLQSDIDRPEELAEQILRLLGDEARYGELQRNALSWCKAHDVRWSASQYRKIYRRLVSR